MHHIFICPNIAPTLCSQTGYYVEMSIDFHNTPCKTTCKTDELFKPAKLINSKSLLYLLILCVVYKIVIRFSEHANHYEKGITLPQKSYIMHNYMVKKYPVLKAILRCVVTCE